MDFGKSQIVNIPSLPVENYDAGNQFDKQVENLFKLANSNNFTAFKGQTGNLDLKSIENNPNLSSDEKYKLTEKLFQTPYQNKTITPASVSLMELDPYMKSRDFQKLGYKPFADNNQRYLDNRSGGNTSLKIFNKFLTSVGVGGASAFTPIGTGLGYLTGTDYGKQWSDKLASWQEVKNDYNQIYYSDAEKQASGMNPFKTPTKFFDNLLPSLGFTVGNIAASYFTMRLGGNALMKGFSAFAKESELFRTLQRSKLGMYRGMKGMDALAGERGLVAGAEATVQNINRTTKVLQGLKSGAGNVAKILPYSFYSAAGEGHIEASMAKQEFYHSWFEDYKQKHGGALPSAEEQIEMTKLSEQVYDETLKYNTIVLTLTNTLEIGALVKKMGLTGELLKRTGLGKISKVFDVDDIAFKGFKEGWKKKTFKEMILPYTTVSTIEALGESFEEASQYAISRGVQTWATQKFNDPNAVNIKKDWLEKLTGFETDSFSSIASMKNIDDEMKSNAYFGFLSGLGMSGGTKVFNSAYNKISKAPDVAQKRADLLNKGKDFLSLKFLEANENKVNNYTQNAGILKEAIKNGDIFSLKNMQFADLYTWTANSIAAGGFDLRVEQLLDLKSLSKEDFESFFNLEYNEDTKSDVNSYIDKVIKEGKEISKDIEQFRNTDNIFNFNDKPKEELTKEEKEENENYELFENVKYEMAYSYSRLKNFNKRNTQILSGLEDAIGGTQTLTNLKRILFSENGILEYKNILQEEIKTLQSDLKSLGTDSIFKEDFNKKQKEIKEKENILDSLNASKEDIDKWIEESKDTLTDVQKQNLLALTRRGLDKSNLKTILKYEIEKLHKEGIELKLGENKALTPEEMMSAIETPILDIYNINSSKGIVLDKFNKLSTIKGAKKFINEYKELQDRFENGTVKKDVFKDEFRDSLVENGYPIGTTSIGVTLTYFNKSLDTVEENERQLTRLNESSEFAINSIKETKFKPKKEEDKEEISFSTEFIFADKEIKLTAKSREDLLDRIEKVKENLKKQKYDKEVSNDYIIKRTLKSIKNKDDEWVSTPAYEILTKRGDPAFNDQNRKFTGKELFDFLRGINTLSNTSIRKYEIIPFSKFESIQKGMISSIVSKNKLKSLNIRFDLIENRRVLLQKQMNALKASESGNEMLNSPLRDLLNSNYLVIYELELKLQELLSQSKVIKTNQDALNAAYKAARGNKAKWLNTKEGKEYKKAYTQIQEEIKSVQSSILKNKEDLEIFNKENEELFSFYNTLNEIQLELNAIVGEKSVLKVYGDKLITNLKELSDGTTTEYVTFTTELNELKDNLFKDLSEEEIKVMTEEFQNINEKHEQLRVLKNQYQNLINVHNNTLKIHQKEIDRIQSIIDELEEEIQYNSEEGAKQTLAFINNLKPSLIGLDTELQKINSDIELLNQKILEIDNVIKNSNSSILEDYIKFKNISDVFVNISRASLLKESLTVNKNISDFKNGDYHGQRKRIIKNGEVIILEFDPIDKEDASKMKPNFVYQLTSQDITANISPEMSLNMTKEEIEAFPNIEFHRFLSEFTANEIQELFEVLIVTPASIKESNPELYIHLENQFTDKRDMSETTDLFSVIIDKNTKKIVKKNGKFLTSSFYKAENKFKTNAEGLPLHITEKAVLDDFIKFSEQYEKDIEEKTKEEIDEYLKDKETLSKAIAFSKQRYEDDIDNMLESINSGKFLISEIKDVTSGIFLWGEAKDVAKVMGINSNNANDFALGIVLDKKGGSLTYLDNEGVKQEIGQNLSAGTTAIINKKTGEWIPFVHKEQDDKSLENILGILTYITNEHQKSGKSILELGKTNVPYADGEYQLLWNTERNYEVSVDRIPLFPTLFNPKKEGRKVVLGELSKIYGARWSIITTLMNFGKDTSNSKNSIYFDEFNKLHYYDFNVDSIRIIDVATLSTLLNSYQNGKVDELTDEEKLKLSGLVQHIKQKRKNISYHYALSTKARTKSGKKFLFKLPKYNAKTGQIEFKTFDSYLEYVIGLGTPNSGIVQTKVEKVDNRTSFQKSLILDTDFNNRLNTSEIVEISKEYLDISKVEAKEETEEEAPKTSIEVKKTPIVNIEDLTINENIADIDEDSEDILYLISNNTNNIAIASLPGLLDDINFKGNAISLNKLNSTNKGKKLAKDLEKAIDKLKNSTDPFEKDINRVFLKYQFHFIYKKLYNIDLQTSQPKAVFDIPNGSIIEIKNLGEYKVVDEFNFFAGNTIILRNEENKHILLTKELLEQGLKENKIKVTKAITETTSTTSNKSEIESKKAEIERRIQEVEDFVNQDFFANTDVLRKHWQSRKDLFENKLKQLKSLLAKGLKTGDDLKLLTNILNDLRAVTKEGIELTDKNGKISDLDSVIDTLYFDLADSLLPLISDNIIREYITLKNESLAGRSTNLEKALLQYKLENRFAYTTDGKDVEYFLSKETLDNAKNNKQINAKYDAELATLKSKTATDIEAKKAEIEKLEREIEQAEKEKQETLQPLIEEKEQIEKEIAEIEEELSEAEKLEEQPTPPKFKTDKSTKSVDAVIEENVTEQELKQITQEESLKSKEEAKEKIKEEVVNQMNDKTNTKPKTLLQKIAYRIKKILLNISLVAIMFNNISFTFAPSATSLTYDNARIENLQSFDDVKLDQDALNKLEDINIITEFNKDSNEKYLIVDKNAAMAHLYQGDSLITSYEVGTGKNKGDAQTKTVTKNGKVYWEEGNAQTGAGIYTINNQHKYKSSPSYTLLNENGIEVSTVLHETLPERKKLFADNNTENNRMSYGCVNFQAKSLQELGEEHKDFTSGSKVYILPDNPNNKFKIVDGKLIFSSENKDVNRTLKKYEAQPITVKADNINEKGKEFLQTIADNKSAIMDLYPTVSNDEYNQIVKIAYGIFGQESSFGTFGGVTGLRGQTGRITDLGQIAANSLLSENYNPSVGVTQIRYSNIRQEVKDAFGISEISDLLNTDKAAIATISHLLDIYVNEIPNNLKDKADKLLPLAYSNHSDFIKYKKNKDSNLLNNKYVQNVNKNGENVKIYLGLNEETNSQSIPKNGHITNLSLGLLALLKRRKKGDNISDEDINKKRDELLDKVESLKQRLAEVNKKIDEVTKRFDSQIAQKQAELKALEEAGSVGVGRDVESKKKSFTEAGEQSKKDQSPKALGNFIIDNAQVGDRIKINENEYYEVVSKKTNKKGHTETELQHFVKNEETGEFENNPAAVKLFTDKYRGTDQEKLGYRDASDLFESTYTNNKGERVTEQSTFEPKVLEQKESIIDEKTLEGFSSEEDLAKAFGVKPLEQSKNLEELTKEELWKELVDLGYDSYESLEEYESFIKDFGIKGTIEETLIQTIKNNKTEEKDSFIDLSLNKILKDNNITKNC